MSSTNIVFFYYHGSPYGERIKWYLILRGIPFAESIQPSYMPRPDLEHLGISYRRIPILAIGRDVYFDTRLILLRLEQIEGYGPKLGATTPEGLAIERLLAGWTVDNLFWKAVQLVPMWNTTLFSGPNFVRDREEMTGGKRLVKEELLKARPEAAVYIRSAFQLLEDTILSDGREWILGGEKPSLADINGTWPLQWLAQFDGALEPDHASEAQFPKTFALIKRFRAAVDEAEKTAPAIETLEAEQKFAAVLNSDVIGKTGKSVDPKDPLQLEAGQQVEVLINDLAPTHKDRGSLVALNIDEVVIENSKGLHLHFPRWGFTVTKL